MTIQKPELLNLYDFLTNRLFEIPEYQRTYSWSKSQRKDLFADILKIEETDQEHFMSTIVCLRKDKKQLGGSRFEVLDIVDGQQRITTLIILLKTLCIELLEGSISEKAIGEDLFKLLIKERDQTVILLQTNHDTSNIFSNYLRTGELVSGISLKTLADKNLQEAFVQSESFIIKHFKNGKLTRLYEILMEKLKFILHIIEDEGIVYTVFEVLNSRGLEVEWLDKCKSILLGLIYENTTDVNARTQVMRELHSIWGNIYRVIGIDSIDSNEIIQFAATLKFSDKASEPLNPQESIKFFRKYCSGPNGQSKTIEISNFLLQVAEKLLALKKMKSINAISKYKHVRLLKIAIDLRGDFDDDQKTELTELWEKVSFKIYGIARKDNRSGKGPFTKLSQQIVQKKQVINSKDIEFPIADIKQRIRDLGVDLVDTKEAYNMITNKDLYFKTDWSENLKYFFYKYERYLHKKAGFTFPDLVWESILGTNENDSIEHIYPQNPSSDWNSIKDSDLHRLGNLAVITPELNSQARHHSFDIKKVTYEKEKRLLSIQKLLDQSKWTSEEIENRERELIDWAKSYWG